MMRKSMYILNLNQHMPIFYNIFLYFHLAQVQQYLQLLFFLILHICKLTKYHDYVIHEIKHFCSTSIRLIGSLEI